MKQTTSLLMLFCSCSLIACSNSTSHAGTSPRVVPADLRDVERNGEGLVSTTFGAYDPDPAKSRIPDWSRTASVLSLLEQVWSLGKQANPGMPAAQVKMVDMAIVTIGGAIQTKDQKSAAIAANAVGLAVPPLFDYFHPDAPIEIVRMDAVFRQVGIDTHFGEPLQAGSDVDSLRTDWANAKAAVESKVPTCHRVANTANVVGDVEQSLANLSAALATSDSTTLEVESENGALEIDTLELLFDCPADNAKPTNGVGSDCSTGKTCDADFECDPANGKCAPSSTNSIGTPCLSTTDCGTDSRAACQTASGDNYPGGYCFMEPCNDIEVCPAGASCVSLGGESPGCFKSCTSDADCRTSENYVCQLFLTTPPVGFGPSDHACAFACTRNADCQSPLTCDIPSGKCRP
ncbi:MAG: hypothetical protein ABI627_07630 [Polyangiaceae bacterium]